MPNARHDSQQAPESGGPGTSALAGDAQGAGSAGLAGAAGNAGFAGTDGLADAAGPQPTQPTSSSSAGVGLGTASALSPALQFDGSLHDRRFLPSNQQGSIESGPLQALQVTQAAQITPTPPAPPQLPTVPPVPVPLASSPHLASPPQPALAPQLAAPLFSLASAAPGEHVMTLRVAPDDLGPLTVRAHIDAAGVRIELFAPGDAGRDAVRHVLPELRRSLEDSGASLSLSSQNSPPDAGKDPGQGNGRDPGQGTGQGAGPGNGARDPDARPRGAGEPGSGEPGPGGEHSGGAHSVEPGSGEGGPDGSDAQPQLPPGVVRGLSTPNRLDILV
ncbi:flagellar hook-length control protein FliK [Paenarthrobacter sp. GOM3]|uniref:flagellar hook-length control protein FliK n=1 Tax=Paenarthrobacter sp. GOM3 TaxID=2782567 RepID=UPI001BABAE8B|nr:flagellar hook-length control protein FliK [Paenarthrobacter sp. GOM3]WOH19602.1 flagellar hook-length control protein FliK [Paenarthrobacter sp. GOM3]